MSESDILLKKVAKAVESEKKATKARNQAIREAMLAGVKRKDIAEITGMTESYLYKLLKKNS